MLKKKQGNQWIDSNMFWYTYGTTQKEPERRFEKKQNDDEDDDTPDEEATFYRRKGSLMRNVSNCDMKPRKVTFAGKVEHEYYDANLKRSNSFIGSPVEKIKGVKNRLTDKLMNYYERVPFLTESIKERFEEFLDKMPFFHKPEYTTEVLKPDKMPQPKVLRPEDVPSQDSDSNIGILVTIGDNVQPKKNRIPLLSSLSETFFGKKENSECSANASLDGLMKKLPKDRNFESFDNELNNHNSIDNETPTFFVFEPLDELKAEDSITLTKKPSLWEKIKSDKNNTNNNSKIFVICKNKHMNGNNKKISFKGFRIRKIKGKPMLNDPKLPSSKYDYNKKVNNWMKNVENQNFENDDYLEQKENIQVKNIISNKKQGVSDLVKMFEKESFVKLPQNNLSEVAKKVNFDPNVKAFNENVLKIKSESVQSNAILKRSVVSNHFQSPPASPSHSFTRQAENNEVCLKSSELNAKYVKYKNSTEDMSMKRMSSDVEKRKETKFKKFNFNRSMSAKKVLRELVKKTFKLKSLSPSERSYKILKQCQENAKNNYKKVMPQRQFEEKIILEDKTIQDGKNYSEDYLDNKKSVPTLKYLKYVENPSKCSISEKNRAARNQFFGIVEPSGNKTQTDQSFLTKTKKFSTQNSGSLNDHIETKNISRNNVNINNNFEKARSCFYIKEAFKELSETHVSTNCNNKHGILESSQIFCDASKNSSLTLSNNKEKVLNNASLIEAIEEMNKKLYKNIFSIENIDSENKPLSCDQQKIFESSKADGTNVLHDAEYFQLKIHANLQQHKLFKNQKTKQFGEEAFEKKQIILPDKNKHFCMESALNRKKFRNTNEFHKTVSAENYQSVKSTKRRRSHQPSTTKNFRRVDKQVLDLFDRVISQMKNGGFEKVGDQGIQKLIEEKKQNKDDDSKKNSLKEMKNEKNNGHVGDKDICFTERNNVKHLIRKFDEIM